MTLKNKWPNIYNELLNVKDILETHYHDVCEFEFVVEKGRLFINDVRIAKGRSLIANLRFALQFYQEEKIDLGEAIARIPPKSIEYIVQPEIINEAALSFLGRGISGSPGATTGRIALNADSAEALAESGEEVILVLYEVRPEDIAGIFAARGILTARGGKTSHAAARSREMGKPCVVGFELMDFDFTKERLVISNEIIFKEGDWITINGSDGSVYSGKGEITLKHWSNHPELIFLNQMIECAIFTNKLQHSNVGDAWRIRDFFIHCVPISPKSSSKKAIKRKQYNSFVPPNKITLQQLRNDLVEISELDRHNYSSIIVGLSDALFRILTASLGMGNHHLFFRPLWDPKSKIKQQEGTQFVGFEYFDINRYVTNLIDISDIRFLLDVKLSSGEDEWFLDFTNPNGESLVGNSHSLKSYRLLVNGAIVNHNDLPIFYNYIRKREYYWKWYENKKTQREEIIAFLKDQHSGERISNHRLILYCEELGLLNHEGVTDTGLSLIGKRIRSKCL